MQRTWIDPGGPELFHKGMEKRFLAGGEIRSPAREMRISSAERQGRTRVLQGRAQRIRFRKIEAKAMQPCIRNQRDGDRFSRGAAQIRQQGKLRKSSQGKYQTGIHRRRKMACRGHAQENDLLIETGALTAFMTPMPTAAVPYMMAYGGYRQRDLFRGSWLFVALGCVICVGWIMSVMPIL